MAAAAAGGVELQDLTGAIDMSKAVALNAKAGFGLANALSPEPALLLKSDDDDELLMMLPFTSPADLRCIEIDAPTGNAPAVIKVFRNRSNMTFGDVNDFEPDAKLEDAAAAFEAGHGTVRLELTSSAWRNTSQITIFVSNEDLVGEDEMTHVSAVRMIGTIDGPMSMADLKGGGAGNAMADMAGGAMPAMGPGDPPGGI